MVLFHKLLFYFPKGLDDSTPDTSRKSSHELKLSAEIKAMYTTHKTVTVTLVHFNDVYNVEPGDREPVGGAARFATIIKSILPDNPLIFFSGDALNPSISKLCQYLTSNEIHESISCTVETTKSKTETWCFDTKTETTV